MPSKAVFRVRDVGLLMLGVQKRPLHPFRGMTLKSNIIYPKDELYDMMSTC